MSYSMLIAVAFAFVAVSSSLSPQTDEQKALARFYTDFAQLYRLAPVPTPSADSLKTQRYQFLFTEDEFNAIKDESLMLLHTTVIERSIVRHATPNFETEGARFLYRLDPKDPQPIEIELVRVADKLFRRVDQPNNYFYLPTFQSIEYINRVPMVPFYEVNFICNITAASADKSAPLLSYIDKTYSWTPRYMLDLSMFGQTKKPEMFAFADLENMGDVPMTVKAAELIAGDIRLIEQPTTILPQGFSDAMMDPNTGVPNEIANPLATNTIFYADQLGEQASGAYVFQLRVPSSIVMPARSTVSLPFFEPHVTVAPFFSYLSLFQTVNGRGKLFKAYNITSVDTFLPAGRLMLHEQDRFVGEINIPDLAAGEVYVMQFGHDADVAYRRQVRILQGDEESNTMTYSVEITFENHKPTRDISVDFVESFSEYKYYDVTQISNKDNIPDLVLLGTELRGQFSLPQRGGRKVISYDVTVYKVKPVNIAPIKSITVDTINPAGMTQPKPVLMDSNAGKTSASKTAASMTSGTNTIVRSA